MAKSNNTGSGVGIIILIFILYMMINGCNGHI
jgi:hypothetical protein